MMGNPRWEEVHIVCIGIDLTDKRKAEEEAELRRRQLMEADKMASLGVLASGIAHEINNPNNFIMMNAPILRTVWEDISPILEKYYDKCGDFTSANIPYSEMREEVPKLFDGIEEGSKRIRQMILNMKNFAKRDISDMNHSVNMNDVITAALGLLSHEIKKSTQSISIETSKSLPSVRGNLQRLEQVVMNLIQNACQSLPDRNKGISIKTSYDKEKDRVIVCVADEGVGIKLEHMGHIFDPFFTTKSDNGGTGLGLSLCADIVKEHHGGLQFESELGKGTTVYLSLPVMR
jgi:signal transduction histidine kinase